ncbi:MAG: 2-aminoethylphosphonate--pyruvate transaminase [Pelovirga sp.]
MTQPVNPYLLLTPGPLSTTATVKEVMLRDWCTWDRDYNNIVQQIRAELVALATPVTGYTAVLMQGSGTFSVEATLTSAIPATGKLLVLANGAYGDRMGEIARCIGLAVRIESFGEISPVDPDRVRRVLAEDRDISHVAVVHCETTTGMLNPVDAIGAVVKDVGKTYIVDAMSSFGGMPINIQSLQADFLISSANKCIQGVPGFGFVVARTEVLEGCEGNARSLSLDLYDQWRTMEEGGGKWRFTSPTHVVRAFAQALEELQQEGFDNRCQRYAVNQRCLVEGMRQLGFSTLLPDVLQSPIITSFHSPAAADYSFSAFYKALKQQGFVIYPGKVTVADTFRIGNIGDVYPDDIDQLLVAVENSYPLTPRIN